QTIASLQNDTTIEMKASKVINAVEDINISDKKSTAYIKNTVLYLNAACEYDVLSLYSVQGVKVYSSKDLLQEYNVMGLKPGIYIVVLANKGQKKEAIKVIYE
ncbi:MAG: T9SS type A sorting domain-containing protein, partial [Bacteroidales bacterium]|nr:T9SS type A sorting domain-containing protein [Bacteroidales bacterium]